MTKDWTKIYKKYKGLWVAFAQDQMTVLGSGKTAEEAFLKARKKSKSIPTLTRMPSNLSTFVGIF
jgi:hypothetical protein